MNLNKKIGFLLDNGLSPNFISSMNEGQVNTIFNRLVENKKETKEAVQTTQKSGYETKITPGTKANIQIDGTIISSSPDKGITIQSTKAPVGTGEQTEGEMTEKFESKAQQGLFWARCNKCKDENCKWCKMAKEFSKSTSKKQYEKMPEKKHPEKTVKYKKKKKTNEEFTMANYFDKVASVYANNAMGKTVDSLTKEQFVKKHINKIVENNLRPTMKKRDLLKLIESEIKHKKGLNEDFYMDEMDEEFDFMSDVETAPIIKPKIKPKRETEPEWEPDEEEPVIPDPNADPEPQADTDLELQAKEDDFSEYKDDFDFIMSRMNESLYKPIKVNRF